MMMAAAVLACLANGPLVAQNKQAKEKDKASKAARQEERKDYYQKWLNEDAVYLITEEERSVFSKLTTDEEKEQFIEQFWHRRDPDYTTAVNEFKEEHYRRIAYANERFASGSPGWLTDRGRIYIIHGPPDGIETNPGGPYFRKPEEGGGMTSVYPFEVWRYRYIEGLGPNIELEFVDRDGSNQYKLALRPDDKDALLTVPGAGLTLAEQIGTVEKADRPIFQPGNRETYPYLGGREEDGLFQRYERFSRAMVAPPIRYNDLKEIVDVSVRYDTLPFEVRPDYFRLNEQSVLVPITLKLENKNLNFKEENGLRVARVALYGIVTSMTNRIALEFDDDLVVSFTPEEFQQSALRGYSLYQKAVPLETKMRYKMDIVTKDLNSGKVGTMRQALIPPSYGEKLAASSIVLSNYIRELRQIPQQDEMFVIGDVKIRPSLDNRFPEEEPFGVYLQIYNAGLDQTSLAPSLSVKYQIQRNGEVIAETVDESGESIQYHSGLRVVLVKNLLLKPLEPARYQLEITVQDRITDQTVTARADFRVDAPSV